MLLTPSFSCHPHASLSAIEHVFCPFSWNCIPLEAYLPLRYLETSFPGPVSSKCKVIWNCRWLFRGRGAEPELTGILMVSFTRFELHKINCLVPLRVLKSKMISVWYLDTLKCINVYHKVTTANFVKIDLSSWWNKRAPLPPLPPPHPLPPP